MIMTENNTKFVPSLIVIATFLVFLDAYMIFDVPYILDWTTFANLNCIN
jgi:hypothetical protein